MARKIYKIEIRLSVQKDLKQIDLRYHRSIWKKIETLAEEPFPRGCVKLKAQERIYRIRVGIYRVFYKVIMENQAIYIEHIQHRQSAYKK